MLMNFERLDMVVLLALFIFTFYSMSLLSYKLYFLVFHHECLSNTVNTPKIFNILKFAM
jgi:hypothetical protein